jgi:hypothetical protein
VAIELPYVSIDLEGDSETVRTSSGTILSNARIRFSVFAATYDAAQRIAFAIADHFNRASFPWSRGRVLDMKPANRQEEVDSERGSWMIAMDFRVRAAQDHDT